MRRKILFSSVILLMAVALLAFKSIKKDPRVISPDVAALVVASKPALDKAADGTTSDNLKQEMLNKENTGSGYLDSDISDNSEMITESTIADQEQTDKFDMADKNAVPGEDAVEVREQTELFEEAETDLQTAPPAVYTIQTGSFTYTHYARDHFDSIIGTLGEEELDYLRIETVGQFNTVRLGKFEDFKSAEEFLTEITPRIMDAIILKAYIKDERILQQIRE